MPVIAFCRSFWRRTDLRFPEGRDEFAFRKSLERTLVVRTLALCAAIVLGSIAHLLPELLREMNRSDDQFAFAGDDPRTLRFSFHLCGLILLPLFLLFLGMLWWLQVACFKTIHWEVVVTLAMSWGCSSACFSNAWTAALLYGEDPRHVWLRDMRASEGMTALLLDALTTGICLFLPIRMILKWIPPVSGCISFTISSLVIGSPFPDSAMSNSLILGALALFALVGAWNNEQEARRSWTAHAQVARKSQELLQQHTGVYRILDRLCDGLVHIGDDYSILDPNPRFAALLLCRNVESLRNGSFCDFFASDQDRNNFTSALQGADANGGMVHVNLLDSSGREFLVYAYHTRTYDYEGACGHMVALIEAQERQAPDNYTDSVLGGSLKPSRSKPQKDEGAIDARSDSECSSSLVEIAAWVDVASNDLTIVSCTPGFTILGPVTTGKALQPLLGSEQNAKDFRKWLQEASNSYHFSDEDAAFSLDEFPLRFHPIADLGLEFSARCKPDFQSLAPDFGEDVDRDCLLRVVFNDLECHQSKRPRRKLGPKRYREKPSRAFLRM